MLAAIVKARRRTNCAQRGRETEELERRRGRETGKRLSKKPAEFRRAQKIAVVDVGRRK